MLKKKMLFICFITVNKSEIRYFVVGKLEWGIFKIRWIHTIPITLNKTFMTQFYERIKSNTKSQTKNIMFIMLIKILFYYIK